MNQISLELVNYTDKISEIKPIRIQVFQVEQGVDPALEFDGLDETAEHILAYLDNQPVGTLRIRYLDNQLAKIERLAVLSAARGQGIGRKLTEKAIEVIEQKEISKVMIHAQEYVKGLYEKLGFEQVGGIFEEAGISHIKMIKHLR
ncbi:GNAT family N-acetyltransferase [Microcoleus sp. FACHB-SPT15]|uniref:GNAT family N-acetyltransferase n=1 Tax=Microcoleus sp. FACHB-SPT15 TaxID=2692830 RepID=UPI00177F8212|nr:GNAT family N-acetyltransferase [Microcoleus sp. FACHB-SPT15]MBD1804375.1 GNAT family N-acetyltransferase [Microcoleus sp. FACHB-SPT15]